MDTTQSISDLHHLVFHRVTCDGYSNDHERHETSQDYLDHPRMLAKQNRCNPLEGRQAVRRVEWYLDDHPEVSFAILYVYDCQQYHDQISDLFESQPMPANMDDDTVASAKPYFSVLPYDAKEAVPYSRTISPSRGLKLALKYLQVEFPEHLRDWDSEMNLCHPYLQLYHCKNLFAGPEASALPTAQQYHLASLLRYMNGELAAEYEEAEDDFRNGVVRQKHWTKLFRPNDLVATVESGEDLGFLCISYPRSDDSDALSIQCWSWGFDGAFFRQRRTMIVHWPSRSDRIAMSDLNCYPLRFGPHELSDELARRGTVFWSCRKRNFVEYKTSSSLKLQPTSLRYMIDTNVYNILHPEDEANERPEEREELDEDEMGRDDAPGYPFTSLLPAKIRGFAFKDKKWSLLKVRHISEIDWDVHAFTRKLVLDKDKKDLIQALVTNHSEKKESTKSDFLKGKGEGLLILLHGGPGTGKTLTAETVAEFARTPLYQVTCGDIGTKPEAVEAYLESVMFIAETWNCVVLLDEADVFLETRERLDLERNALVSVFLRVLEYYEGIMILTSNRIGLFDEAFKSRIQLSLYYPPLNQQHRQRVWENFIKFFQETDKGTDFKDLRESIVSLSQYNLNGRQIRNTLNTARQLAQFRKEPMEYAHLEQAIKNVLDFEEYILTLHDGETEEDRAKRGGIRHSKKRRLEEAPC